MIKFEPTPKKTTIAVYAFLTLSAIAILCYVVFNIGTVFGWIGVFFEIISPIIIGFIIAYLCNPIMLFFHKKVFAFIEKKKPHPRTRRGLSVLCAFIIVLGMVSVIVGLFVPQIVTSYSELSSFISKYLESLQTTLDNFIRDFPLFNSAYTDLADFVDVNELTAKLSNLITDSFDVFDKVITYVTTYLSSFVSGVNNTIMGVILSVYFLLSREKLMAQIRKLSAALMSEKHISQITRIITLADKTFGGYIKGALLDAMFVGFVSLIIMSIFKIPYAPLIAVIVGATNIIPYFGPFIGAIPSGFFILISEPPKVITFVIIILVIQQIDGNLICPRIMNSTTGLDALLVIFALTIGGGLFGVAGMLLSIPTFAMLYSLFKDYVEKRLIKNEMPPDTRDYYRAGEEPDENPPPSLSSRAMSKASKWLKNLAVHVKNAVVRFLRFIIGKFKRKPKPDSTDNNQSDK